MPSAECRFHLECAVSRPAYEPVIGLEIHAHLTTATKIFCGCSTAFGAPPNTQVCPVCLGLPGALPVLNRRAVELAIKASLALGCTIQARSIFARKNYFYPDLPKGYQISQYERPLATGGSWHCRRRRTRRAWAHAHPHGRGCGQVAAPRTGRLGSGDVARLQPQRRAAHRDRHRARSALGRRRGRVFLAPPRNSRRDRRQRRQHGRGQLAVRRQRLDSPGRADDARHEGGGQERQLVPVPAEGARVRNRAADRRGLDRRPCASGNAALGHRHGETTSMRSKEEAHDYRYFPEPDLPPLDIPTAWIAAIAQDLPELPEARKRRFIAAHGLSEYDADLLVRCSPGGADYFEAMVAAGAPAKAASNWIRARCGASSRTSAGRHGGRSRCQRRARRAHCAGRTRRDQQHRRERRL